MTDQCWVSGGVGVQALGATARDVDGRTEGVRSARGGQSDAGRSADDQRDLLSQLPSS